MADGVFSRLTQVEDGSVIALAAIDGERGWARFLSNRVPLRPLARSSLLDSLRRNSQRVRRLGRTL